MEQKNKQSYVVSRWEQLYFQERQAKTEIIAKADILRNQITLTELARASHLLSAEACDHTIEKQLTTYSSLVDTAEEKGGLNNHADSILTLIGMGTNVSADSRNWKSSFQPNVLDAHPSIQANLHAAKQSLLPNGKVNTKITLTRRKLDTQPVAAAGSQVLSQPGCSSAQQQDGRLPLKRCLFSAFDNTVKLVPHETNVVSRTSAPGLPPVDVNLQSSSRFDSPHTANSSMERTETSTTAFRTARQQLFLNDHKKSSRCRSVAHATLSPSQYGSNKRSLGARRGPAGKFVPPVLNRNAGDDDDRGELMRHAGPSKAESAATTDKDVDPRLKNFEPRMIELVISEIMDHGPAVEWDDIAGLEFVKKTVKEIVIWPMLRPDIFYGLRGPPKGLLLFGPPGTGKTLIGKCIASQSKSTFFSISASSLTSKWVGEGEKMVRALFAVARVHQPAVIFIDEIDSLLSQRSNSEHESSRRIKTEFLVQLDGATTGEDDRILVVGATNRPQEIDEAARRRFVKRLYVPLPEGEARKQIVQLLMSRQANSLSCDNFTAICDQTEGYSGADMANLCREAALGPIRSLCFVDIQEITADEVRPISYEDFVEALQQVRASVSKRDLDVYIEWNKQYGSWHI